MNQGLARRVFLSTAGVVALAVTTAVLVTWWVGRHIADDAVHETLERSGVVQEAFDDLHLGQLALLGTDIANDPYFAGYMAEALAQGEILSVADQLGERQSDIGYDLAVVLAPEGEVLFDLTDPSRNGEDLSSDPLFQLGNEDPYNASAFFGRGGALYRAVIVPIRPAGVLHGWLILGFSLDDVAALELRRISDTEISYFAFGEGEPQLVTTTHETRLAERVASELRRDGRLRGTEPKLVPLDLVGKEWTAYVRPLPDAYGEPLGAVVSLASLEERRAPFRRIIQVLSIVGIAAVLLSLIAAWLVSRQILAPLRELSDAAQRAALGDYDQKIAAAGRKDEVGRLASAFSALLSELREKRDMEAYIAELGRTLPDPGEAAGSETLALAPPSSQDVALLGVEVRTSAPTADGEEDPRIALDQLARDMGQISLAVGRHSGKVEAVLGHRLVASFEGRRPEHRGLSAAAEILAEQSAEGTKPVAMVLVNGRATTGSLLWDETPRFVITGAPMVDLENLLRVARQGSLLLSEAVRAELGPILIAAGVELQALKSSVSTSPLFNVTPELASRLGTPDVAATQMLTQSTLPTLPTLSGVSPGSLLGERFEILSVLGAGGMGVVYKARDRSLDELVALKMIKDMAVAEGGEGLQRLKDELKLARKIGHANVLRTYDFGDLNGFPFISMEYVRGITLRQLLDQSGSLPLSAGLRLARQLCRGLAAAHAQGVLHRDIKPENLIIEPTGNAKLMDFGIAQPVRRTKAGTQTRADAIVGTPYYLAPEQVQGHEPDERADIYACGVVFFEIFTGELPYPREGSMMQVISRKLQEPPTPPREYWSAMPAALERIILRCLERDRDDRYANVDRLLEELEALRG